MTSPPTRAPALVLMFCRAGWCWLHLRRTGVFLSVCRRWLGWLVIMPLMCLFGGDAILFPVTDMTISQQVAENGVSALWGNYLRYIGAGAVACGGVLSLLKSLPMIIRTFKDSMGVYGKGREASTLRTQQDISMRSVLLGILIVALALWLIPAIPLNFFTALIVIVFGFFFATVSSRMVV